MNSKRWKANLSKVSPDRPHRFIPPDRDRATFTETGPQWKGKYADRPQLAANPFPSRALIVVPSSHHRHPVSIPRSARSRFASGDCFGRSVVGGREWRSGEGRAARYRKNRPSSLSLSLSLSLDIRRPVTSISSITDPPPFPSPPTSPFIPSSAVEGCGMPSSAGKNEQGEGSEFPG